MAVPKKRTSMSKKRIRRNIWKKKGSLAEKPFIQGKQVPMGIQKVFLCDKQILKPWNNLN